MGITEMKCPACGAPLKFSAVSGKIECEYCGTKFEVEELIGRQSAAGQEKQESAKQSGQTPKQSGQAQKQTWETAEQTIRDENGREYSWGDIADRVQMESMEDAKVYVCKSCGAELVTTDTTASLKCPYCDNEIVLDERISGSVKPNGIIPFKIDAKQLPDIIKKFYGKKPLLPNNFFDMHRISETQGMYIPYWMFSGQVDARLSMEGTQVRHFSQGEYDCTETSYYVVERDGNLQFSGVPVDAHTRIDNTMTEAMEPYDMSEMKPFASAYLAGFVTDRFDTKPDACMPRAQERMYTSVESAFKQTAAGYTTLRVHGSSFDMRKTQIKYVLMPAYLINCQYNGKDYRFAVNGQTGKIVGELPIDKGKQKKAFLTGFLIPAAVVFAAVLLLL